ncbi:MAG: hypothetical protein LUO93_03995 [Methanomicrobiales archaeon]|nr:hypothetical protein [Methanomicrobiales archaeon]
MHQIITAAKRETGVEIQYEDQSNILGAFFTYSQLIDMKINALDLLKDPEMYLFDETGRSIRMSSEKSAKDNPFI